MDDYVTGLTSDDVELRKKNKEFHGNQYKGKSFPEIFLENSFSLFNLINLSVIIFVLIFYFSSGDSRLLYDVSGIFLVTLFNTSVSIFQEYKTHRALEKARLLNKEKVNVVRDGKLRNIDSDELVTDDVVKIQQGDRIQADGIIIESTFLETDESLLTGEVDTVSKHRGENVYSGSFCKYGGGYYKVTTTGKGSFASKIEASSRKIKINSSPLLKQINTLFAGFFAITLLFVAIEVIISLSGNNFGNENVRKISTIVNSLLPEGLIFYSTISFITGLVRLSGKGFLIQRMNAPDSFAGIDMLCIDKTGTLTENKIQLENIFPLTEKYSINSIKQIITSVSKITSFSNNITRALYDKFYDVHTDKLFEIPFDSTKKFSYYEYESCNVQYNIILGAYDVLSGYIPPDEKAEIEKITERNLNGYVKSLLLAEVISHKNKNFPHKFLPEEIKPLCILTFRETIRAGVKDTLAELNKIGIEVKVLSGDGKSSVMRAAKSAGITEGSNAYSGLELKVMNDDKLKDVVLNNSVFYRLDPDDKVKIIKILKKAKKEVCMIGDGVNDLPAIKEANSGIAMESSSDITKNSADLILKDDDFELLPEVFKEGLKTVNSVKLISSLILTKNFAFIFITVMSWLGLLTFSLTPRSSAMLNIFAIGLPAYLISIFSNNTGYIKEFVRRIVLFTSYSGVLIGILVLVIFNFLNNNEYIIYQLNFALIFLCISNFFNSASLFHPKKIKTYFYYAISLYVLFILINVSESRNLVFVLISIFYEIQVIPAADFFNVLILSVAGTVLLWIWQRFYLYIKKIEGGI